MTRSVKVSLAALAASLLVFGSSINARADDKLDPTGSWNLKVITLGRPPQESVLKIEKAGDKYVGLMMNAQGRSTPLKDVELKGDELSFRFGIPQQGREIGFEYKGKLTGDSYKGKGAVNFGGRNITFDFTGKRMSAEALALAGAWKINVTLEAGQKIQPTVRLREQGNGWAGGYVGPSGKEVPLQDVKVKDGEISFKVVDKLEEDKVPFRYTGKLTGKEINGSVVLGEGKQSATLKFAAQKVETATANISGVWKLKVPFKDSTFEPTLKITQTGSAFSGSYVGEHGETQIAEALIFGDEFTFEVKREQDKKSYRLKYQGKVVGDTLKGGVEYEFDGIIGSLDFEGRRVADAK